MLELSRQYKLIWMPLVFLLFGLMEPVTAYYLPDILDAVGDLPEGAIINIPTPSAGEVLLSAIGQFNTIGVLVIILASMGILAGERKSGSAVMVLVKPVPYRAFIYSKWMAASVLVWLSYTIGMLASWYYIHLLFGRIDISSLMQAYLVNGVWLSFVVTVTVFFSGMVKSPGAAGFYTIGLSLFITFISGTFTQIMKWSPGRLSGYVTELILVGDWMPEHLMAVTMTVFLCAILLVITPIIFKQSDLS